MFSRMSNPIGLEGNMTMDEVAMSAPVGVRDAASMLRRKLTANMRPYDTAVIRNNNGMVDDWEERLLRKIANKKGQVKSSDVWESWMVYFEGIMIRKMIPLMEQGLLCGESEETLKFCQDILSLPIEQLAEYGNVIVLRAWQILQHELKMWVAEQKYGEVFSKSDDPVEWYRLAKEHDGLFKGRVFPFWSQEQFDDAWEKCKAVTNNQVRPIN